MSYEYKDTTEGLHGVVYYRFIQVDKDGTEETYMVKSVDIKRDDLSPVLSPNPVTNGQANVEYYGKDNTWYKVLNTNGQPLAYGEIKPGKNALDIAHLKPGVYFVQIAGESQPLKLVVQ